MRSRNFLAAAALVGAAAPILATGAGATTPTTASVTIVHGVPATNVDVYVNNKLTLNNFKFGTVTKALSLPAGTYAVAIRPHGAMASSAPILSGTEKLVAGESATIAADLTASGTPHLGVFLNPTSAIPAGDTRVVLRHLAAAPAVDVYAGTTKIASHFVNGAQKVLVIPAATGVPIAITVSGQPLSKAVLGPVKLSFAANTTTIVDVIGSAAGKTLKPVLQKYNG
jgi:hypothetical protein